MSDTVIKVENLSKLYRLGEVGTGTISHDLNRWIAKVRGKEDPFSKLGESNDRTKKGSSEYVWALQDINFEIKKGSVVGIIGRNGAGKSTLLKILSRTTAPTTGNIKIKGRVASLLEVGTGFHPELTGRENIYLNGTILGMRRKEIDRKLDEIVDFAGVERYVDTPVKRYSSGMYVRLAFAVAAHLESEIMIVDEVLAVGDLEFQKKCFGYMNKINESHAKTLLIVSHQLNVIKSLCKESILMANGTLQKFDTTDKVLTEYLYTNKSSSSWIRTEKYDNKYFDLMELELQNEDGEPTTIYTAMDTIVLSVELNVKQLVPELIVGFAIYAEDGTLIFWATNKDEKVENWTELSNGKCRLKFFIPSRFLNESSYFIEFFAAIHYREWIINPDGTAPRVDFEIKGDLSDSPNWQAKRPGIMAPLIKSTIIN